MREVYVWFRDGDEATYTEAVMNLLTTDPDVVEIMDLETGEVIFSRTEMTIEKVYDVSDRWLAEGRS